MSDKENRSRNLLEQLEKLPEKAQEQIGHVIQGAALVTEAARRKTRTAAQHETRRPSRQENRRRTRKS